MVMTVVIRMFLNSCTHLVERFFRHCSFIPFCNPVYDFSCCFSLVPYNIPSNTFWNETETTQIINVNSFVNMAASHVRH